MKNKTLKIFIGILFALVTLSLLEAPAHAANVKLSQINNGGGFTDSTDQLVAVRSGTTDELVTLVTSGNSSTFGTTTGTLTSGDCVKIDSNGNLIDSGGTCGGGSSTVSVLAQSNAQVSHTGDTNETTLVDYTLPANTLPANGTLRINVLWSKTLNSTGTVTFRIRYSTITGTAYYNFSTSTATGNTSTILLIQANNATNAQKGAGGGSAAGLGNTGTALLTSAVDTTAISHIVFTSQNASAGDTGSLEGYAIELLHP